MLVNGVVKVFYGKDIEYTLEVATSAEQLTSDVASSITQSTTNFLVPAKNSKDGRAHIIPIHNIARLEFYE